MIPKVSVIILTYNRAELLKSAITSVLNQTFQDFEIIIVDDASKDNTQEALSHFNDARLKYIRHEMNEGEGKSRNTGINNANGEFIAFLDDDDEWLPEKLKLQVDMLDNDPTIGAVYTGCICIDKRSGNVDSLKIPSKRGDIFQELLKENFVIVSSILLRRTCFEAIGLFDELVPFGLDYDMWIRISEFYQFDFVTKPLVKYSIHQNRLNTNFSLVAQGMEKMFEKYGADFALNAKYYGKKYYNLALLYCLMGNSYRCRAACIKSIKIYPLQLKSYALLALSFVGISTFRKLLQLYLITKNGLVGQKRLGTILDQ
jgi:glycosyltransferase involved in cell wall biosynthesis